MSQDKSKYRETSTGYNHTEYQRAWKQKNREKVKEYYLKYRQKQQKWWSENPWVKSYSQARQRCCNPKAPGYHNYGGKGIKLIMTVEDFKYLWRRDKAHLMEKPSIDRIDNTGDYVLENCRFLELKENCCRESGKPVLQFSKSGKFIKEFASRNEAGRVLKINKWNILSCINGSLKSAGGYVWKREV
jgi:hypothetical protein